MALLPRFALFLPLTLGIVLTPSTHGAMDDAMSEKRLELELDPAAHQLHGSVTWPPDSGEIRFRLHQRLVVTGAYTEQGPVPAVQTSTGQWRIDVPHGTETLTISYGGCLRGADGNNGRGPFLRSDGGLLPAGSAWFPRVRGQDTLAWHMTLTVPEGQRVVASGELLGEQDIDTGIRARYRHPQSRSITVATGPWYEKHQTTDQGVLLRTLFPENLHADHAGAYLDHAAEYLDRFHDEIGAYPLASFQIAASPLPVGLAFPGFTLLGEQVIPLPFIPGTSLAHEVLHAWWGNGVRATVAGGNWTEGLTTYMADHRLAVEREEGREMRRRWLRDYAALPDDADRPLNTFRSGNQGADRVVGYHRGAMLFLMLEDRMGGDAFRQGTRRLWQQHRHTTADWDDLLAAFSHATHEDLSPLFRQWLERAGAPELAVDELQVEGRGDGGYEVTGTLRQSQSDPPFSLAVPMQIFGEDGTKTEVVDTDARETAFRIPMAAPPQRLVVDPDYRLWRRLPTEQAPAMLRAPLLDPEARLVALADDAAATGRQMTGRDLATISPDTTPEGSIMVVGSRRDTTDWLERHELEIPSRVADHDGNHAFAVPDTGVVVLAADSASVHRQLARHIRHRGHDSYVLVAGDGSVTASGDWPTESSPLERSLAD